MSVLWIAHIDVNDPEGHARYAREASPVFEAHGAQFLHRGGEFVQLEGRERMRNVVIRFPSMDAAVACYRSDEYQAALVHAKTSVRDLVIVEEIAG